MIVDHLLAQTTASPGLDCGGYGEKATCVEMKFEKVSFLYLFTNNKITFPGRFAAAKKNHLLQRFGAHLAVYTFL